MTESHNAGNPTNDRAAEALPSASSVLWKSAGPASCCSRVLPGWR